MKTLALNRNALLLLIGMAIVTVAAFIFMIIDQRERVAINTQDTVYIALDHKVYSSVGELVEDADVIILGTVADNGISYERPSEGLRVDDQKPIPALVETEYSIKVDRSLKGGHAADAIVTVVLAGGVIDDTWYVVEDAPQIARSEQVLLYLVRGDDGKFYPLAGGGAIAKKEADRSDIFTLPTSVSGSQQLTVSMP